MKRVLAVLAALLVPPVVYYQTLGQRHASDQRRAESEIRELNTKIEQARAAQRKLPQFHDEVARLDSELLKLRIILPPRIDMANVRGTIDTVAQQSAVRVTRFEATGSDMEEELRRQFILGEVHSDLQSTAAFMRSLANKSMIFDVTSVTLRPDGNEWRTDFILTAYALPDSR